MKMLLGSAATSIPAVTAYSVGIGASFGAIFGVNYPRLARDLSNRFGDMLSGKAIGADWPTSSNLPELKPILTPVVQPAPEVAEQTFSQNEKRAVNYEQLVSQSIKEADTQLAR